MAIDLLTAYLRWTALTSVQLHERLALRNDESRRNGTCACNSYVPLIRYVALHAPYTYANRAGITFLRKKITYQFLTTEKWRCAGAAEAVKRSDTFIRTLRM
jgi:hypothetical protein